MFKSKILNTTHKKNVQNNQSPG